MVVKGAWQRFGNSSVVSCRMTHAGLFTSDAADFDATALQATIAMGEGLMRTMLIARLLVTNGRTVEMAGLEHGVGLLCAKSLDLPPEGGRSVRPHLIALLTELDALTEALRDQAAED